MAYNKLQLQSLAIEEATPGQNAPTDLIFYIDATTGEVKRTEIKDLQISTEGDVYTVNGQTGNVVLDAASVGARPDTYVPDWTEVQNKPDLAPAVHTHTPDDIIGTIPISKLPVGTGADQVAAGNHNHSTAYAPIVHQHKWADITVGVPEFAKRWPNYSEVGLKPSDVPQISQILISQDLNTLTVPGFYYQETSANATSARHYPAQLAGSLLVQKSAGIVQTYITYYGTAQIYTRGFYNGVWSGWSRVYNTVFKPTAADVGAAPVSHTHSPAQVGLSNYRNTATGNYGSVAVTGDKGGYSGINFPEIGRTLMLNDVVQGVYDDVSNAWQWYFANGVLTIGSIPWERLKNIPLTASRWPTFTEVTGKPSTYTPPASTSTVRGGIKHTWNSSTKVLNIIPG